MHKTWISCGIILGLSLTGCETAYVYSGMAYTEATKPRDDISASLRASHNESIVELTPTPFNIGEKRSDVEKRLSRAGYKKLDEPDHWLELEGLTNAEVYNMDKAGLPCAVSYRLYVVFDNENKLVHAAGKFGNSGCL